MFVTNYSHIIQFLIINEKCYKISSLSILLTAIAKYAIGEAYTMGKHVLLYEFLVGFHVVKEWPEVGESFYITNI